MKLHPLKNTEALLKAQVPSEYRAIGYTTFGCMWKRGECTPDTEYICRNSQGNEVPMQSRITAYWPDGSVK